MPYLLRKTDIMPVNVSDIRANLNENILHVVTIIGKSADRRKVFEAIYRGKREIKTVGEIALSTGLDRIRVLQEGGKLHANHIVEKVKKDGETAYKKDETYTHHKNKILSILNNPEKASKFPTKQSPKVSRNSYTIVVKGKTPKVIALTVDEIDSFKEVRGVEGIDKSLNLSSVSESKIKDGIRKIVGESHDFKDWGGEKNDLYTNKLVYKGKRKAAAFALKGKATKGTLVPGKMGKNGDQIPRLVGSTAEMFFVVYHGKVDESVASQLEAFALGKALSGKPIYYCIIDGDDLNRLYQAYLGCFK